MTLCLTPLYAAADRGHFDVPKLLVDHGTDVNIGDKSGRTPLTTAAYNKHYEICRYLMIHADVDYYKVGKFYGDILSLLSLHGDLVLCQKLVQNLPHANINMKNRDRKTALTLSLEHKHHQISNFLMDQGAKLEIDQDLAILYNNCKDGHIDLTKLGVNFVDILCHCSLQGDLGLCQQLIQSNPETDLNGKNRQKQTALNVAAVEEQYNVLDYLLSRGALWEDINEAIKDKLTPLYFLCKGGLFDWVRKFVEEYGAAIQAIDCLSVSAVEEHYDVLEYLLSQGATWEGEDINKPIKGKLTPLYFVCRSGLLNLVTKFVGVYKADINGEGCLQASIEFYHTPIAKFLINSGCNVNQVKKPKINLNSVILISFNFLVLSRNYIPDDGCKN